MLNIVHTKQFIKDLKKLEKRNYDLSLLDEIVTCLSKNKKIPPKYKDHALTGNLKGFRDCHINADWILIYKIVKTNLILFLTQTGTHSDLFGK